MPGTATGMRGLAAAFALGFMAAPLMAATLGACDDDSAETLVRIEACMALLDGVEAEPADRQAAIYTAFGDVLVTANRNQEAVDWLGRALALAPDQPRALLRRSVALNALGRNAEALADLTRLTALTPDNDFAFYRLGYTLDNLGRFNEGLAALDRALALDPEFFWTAFERSRAFEGLERWPETAAAARAALVIRPLNQTAHLRAFRAYDTIGAADKAAYHARILTSLDPNRRDLVRWLDDYVANNAPSLPETLAPTPWQPPPASREVRFLQVLSESYERDEVEEAIGELIGWFRGSVTYPVPDSALVYRQSFRPGARDGFIPVRSFEAVQGMDRPPREGAPRWRGLVQLEQISRRPGPPTIIVEWGEVTPAQAWPLDDGKAVSGQAVFTALCETGAGLAKIMVGCRPDIETVPLGSLDWSLNVAREQIHVPAGWFDTWRLSFAMSGRLSVLGRSREMNLRAQYWLAPELGTWVAGRIDRDGRFALAQAMEVLN